MLCSNQHKHKLMVQEEVTAIIQIESVAQRSDDEMAAEIACFECERLATEFAGAGCKAGE